MTLRILLIDEDPARGRALEEALCAAGYEILPRVDAREDVQTKVRALAPDMIIVDMESPSRDTLEDLRRITDDQPRPIVMFVDHSDEKAIAAAMRAGVSAYVIDGLKPSRVKSVLDVAVARFQEFQKLRAELEQAKTSLTDRRVIERAKGLLMKGRGVDEETAYKLLRKLAMDQNKRLADVAQSVVALAQILKPDRH